MEFLTGILAQLAVRIDQHALTRLELVIRKGEHIGGIAVLRKRIAGQIHGAAADVHHLDPVGRGAVCGQQRFSIRGHHFIDAQRAAGVDLRHFAHGGALVAGFQWKAVRPCLLHQQRRDARRRADHKDQQQLAHAAGGLQVSRRIARARGRRPARLWPGCRPPLLRWTLNRPPLRRGSARLRARRVGAFIGLGHLNDSSPERLYAGNAAPDQAVSPE